MHYDADVVIVGAGLAGLVAAAELADAGKKVILVDQESEQNLGGQAFWSFGGLFLVDSPEQRRLKIKDSYELALQDWLGTAAFDRPEDYWPRKWAEAYLAFAAGEKRQWLYDQGMRFFLWLAGLNVVAMGQLAMAIRCHAFILRGALAQVSLHHSSAACELPPKKV